MLAHGAGGNTLVWWQQVPHFARRCRVVTFDHRGFGRSHCARRTRAGAPLRRRPRRRCSTSAGIDRAALVCQSMGGWTGMQFALRASRARRGDGLSGTPGGADSRRRCWPRCHARQPRRAAWTRDAGVERAASGAGRRTSSSAIPAAALLYAPDRGAQSAGALAQPALHEVMIDPARAGAAGRFPTLLVGGEHDRLFAARRAGRRRRRHPRARVLR